MCLRSVPGTVWRRIPEHPGRSDLIYVQFYIDWAECPRDRRDISAGQTGHVPRDVAIQMWGRPTEFLYVYWFFSLPNKVVTTVQLWSPKLPGRLTKRIFKPNNGALLPASDRWSDIWLESSAGFLLLMSA